MEPTEKKMSVKQKRVTSNKKTNKKKIDPSKAENNVEDHDETSQSDATASQIDLTSDLVASSSRVVKIPESAPKLYIRFKKTIKALSKTSQDLIAMHPLIKTVRLPRQKENSKFFFAICQSEESALKAAKDLRERRDCFVKPAFKIAKKETTKPLASKPKLRYFWQ